MMAVIFVDQPVHVHTTLVNTAINVMEVLVQNVQTEHHTAQEMRVIIVTFAESIPVVKIMEHVVTAINVMEALVRNVQTNTHIVVIVNAVDVRLTTSIV